MNISLDVDDRHLIDLMIREWCVFWEFPKVFRRARAVPIKIPKSMLFRACLYPSPDIAEGFVVHCLELDLIGEGSSPEKAIVELIQAIEIQIESCNSVSQFLFPAPASVWKRYKDSVTAGRIILARIIEQAFDELPDLAYTPTFETIAATSAVPHEYVAVD